jgi:hypothetical protein
MSVEKSKHEFFEASANSSLRSKRCGSDIDWRSLSHRRDESAVGYSLVGCSPAEPTSASPTDRDSNEHSGGFATNDFGHFLT